MIHFYEGKIKSNPHTEKRHTTYQRYEKVGSWEKWIFYMKSLMGEGRRLSSWQTCVRKRRARTLKEIHFHQNPGSSNLVILEALEKYRAKTGDILLSKKDYDWGESLTFKQALYPYRVGKDMHNPSKMHMNFPFSNSSHSKSSQWFNYEYCMLWIWRAYEITLKKNPEKTNKQQTGDFRTSQIKRKSYKSVFSEKKCSHVGERCI